MDTIKKIEFLRTNLKAKIQNCKRCCSVIRASPLSGCNRLKETEFSRYHRTPQSRCVLALQLTNYSHNLAHYLARAPKQKRDNGQWRNIKGQTQSVSALDGDEWGLIRCLPSHLPSLHHGCSPLNHNDD